MRDKWMDNHRIVPFLRFSFDGKPTTTMTTNWSVLLKLAKYFVYSQRDGVIVEDSRLTGWLWEMSPLEDIIGGNRSRECFPWWTLDFGRWCEWWHVTFQNLSFDDTQRRLQLCSFASQMSCRCWQAVCSTAARLSTLPPLLQMHIWPIINKTWQRQITCRIIAALNSIVIVL